MTQRKLVRQGKATLTLSLPADWAHKHHLKEGDEVSIAEVGESLEVSTEKKFLSQKGQIDISGQDEGFVWRQFMGLYQAGVDEIIVTHKNQLPLLSKIANQFIGYAITNQSKDKVIITDLGGLKEMEFLTIFRRLYYLMLDALNTCERFLQDGKVNEELDTINITVNQFTDYCLRYLNKRGLADAKKTSTFSQIVSDLEVLVDVVVSLGKTIPEMTKQQRAISLEKHRRMVAFVRGFYDQIFKFELFELSKLYVDIKKFDQEIHRSKNLPYEHFYLQIISLIKNSTSQMILLHTEKYLSSEKI